MRSNVALLAVCLPLIVACDEQPSRTAALAIAPPVAAWTACSVDTECAAVHFVCHDWVAVNGRYEREVLQWYYAANDDYLSVAECDAPSSPRPRAFCPTERCELVD